MRTYHALQIIRAMVNASIGDLEENVSRGSWPATAPGKPHHTQRTQLRILRALQNKLIRENINQN